MTYFVTGATGFIGRHLVERLLDREGEICVLGASGRRTGCERRSRPGGRGRRVDGPYYIFTAIRIARHYLPGCRSRARLHEHRAGRLRCGGDGPDRPPARSRPPGVPPRESQVPALGCDTELELEGSGIAVPPLDSCAAKLLDYWERHLDPDLFKDRSFQGAVNGKTVLITGASVGIGKAAAIKIARAGGIPLLVARSADKLEQTKREIEELGGTAYTYSADISDPESVDQLVAPVLAEPAAVDVAGQ